MGSYIQVSDALSRGVEPALLCSACPWDRYCITPPEMTRAEVDAKIEGSNRQAEAQMDKARAEGKEGGMGAIIDALMTSVIYGGKDTQATACPVFVARMRSSNGRVIVDRIKELMQAWDDNSL